MSTWSPEDDAILDHYLHHLPERRLSKPDSGKRWNDVEAFWITAQDLPPLGCSVVGNKVYGTEGIPPDPNKEPCVIIRLEDFIEQQQWWATTTKNWILLAQRAQMRYRSALWSLAFLMFVIVLLVMGIGRGWFR